MADREPCESCHSSIDCTPGQIAAHSLVGGDGWDCSDHIGWVDVFQGDLDSLAFAEIDDFSFQECTDILN